MFQGKWDVSVEGFARKMVGLETLGSELGPCPGDPGQPWEEQGVGVESAPRGRHMGDGPRAGGRETGGRLKGREGDGPRR